MNNTTVGTGATEEDEGGGFVSHHRESFTTGTHRSAEATVRGGRAGWIIIVVMADEGGGDRPIDNLK